MPSRVPAPVKPAQANRAAGLSKGEAEAVAVANNPRATHRFSSPPGRP